MPVHPVSVCLTELLESHWEHVAFAAKGMASIEGDSRRTRKRGREEERQETQDPPVAAEPLPDCLTVAEDTEWSLHTLLPAPDPTSVPAAASTTWDMSSQVSAYNISCLGFLNLVTAMLLSSTELVQ